MLYADAAARDISGAGQSCSDPGCCRHRVLQHTAVIAANIIISIVVAFAYVTGGVLFCFHIGCFTAPASAFFVFFSIRAVEVWAIHQVCFLEFLHTWHLGQSAEPSAKFVAARVRKFTAYVFVVAYAYAFIVLKVLGSSYFTQSPLLLIFLFSLIFL